MEKIAFMQEQGYQNKEETQMLKENIKELRKRKGYSQEQLALRLNVVRQTISKWEKGLSVPDAELLTDLAEVLDVTVSELLGKTIEVEDRVDSLDAVATELAKLNELLVIQHQKTEQAKKAIVNIIGVAAVLIFIGAIFDEWNQIFYEFGQNLYHLING